MNLNNKNAKKYLMQLANTNFGQEDLHLTATYATGELPKTLEDAEKEVMNYMRRINSRRKKEGLGPLKYICATKCRAEKDGKKFAGVHHHIIASGGLDKDTVEALWSRREKGEEQGEEIRFINAEKFQYDKCELEDLCDYLVKGPRSENRWITNIKEVKGSIKMIEINQQRIEELEVELKKQRASLKAAGMFHEFIKNKVDENELLLKHHYEAVELTNKNKEREGYKKTECRKCELGKYGDCMTGIEDVLECKELQACLD